MARPFSSRPSLRRSGRRSPFSGVLISHSGLLLKRSPREGGAVDSFPALAFSNSSSQLVSPLDCRPATQDGTCVCGICLHFFFPQGHSPRSTIHRGPPSLFCPPLLQRHPAFDPVSAGLAIAVEYFVGLGELTIQDHPPHHLFAIRTLVLASIPRLACGWPWLPLEVLPKSRHQITVSSG